MQVIFGIDIGGTQIKFGVFTGKGELIDKWVTDTDLSGEGKRIIPDIVKNIKKFIEKHEIKTQDIAGIGMGIPGPVDKDGYVRTCVNLNWHNFNPVTEMEKYFPEAKAAAGNDANVAALGEYCFGAGQKYASAMLITIGTGIGGGIILNGEILSGAHGIAGEIGHIAIDNHADEPCNCGNIGCIDHIASASGIVRMMKKLLQSTDAISVLRNLDTMTARMICEAAGMGDKLAILCIDTCMEPLARGMAIFSHAFDPEVFIIGGGVSRAGDIILEPLRKHYAENMFLIGKGADIRQAQLGNDAGIIGACALV